MSANSQINLGIDLNSIVSKSIKEYITENKDLVSREIKKEVEIAVKELKPNIIHINEQEMGVVTGLIHSSFNDASFMLRQEKQLFLYGPAGSGKTMLSAQLAEGFDLEFGHLSCSAGMSEAHLLGRMLFDGTYVSSRFIELYEKGGLFLLDEIDAADANTLLVINSALANGILSVPNRKDNQTAKRHKDFYCVVAGNTLGTGSTSYAGRNYLDAAFLDRFALCKIIIDYDKKLEKKICSDSKEIYKLFNTIRTNIKNKRINRIVSTRAFVSGVRQHKAGKEVVEIVKTLTLGWSEEEIRKVVPAIGQGDQTEALTVEIVDAANILN